MSGVRKQYPFEIIEAKWQARWDEQQTFRAWNPDEPVPAEHPFARRHRLTGAPKAAELPPKCYILDMFPYPSGAGLHVGHPEGYTATDILCRYRRSLGFNVLHPMGWDAFGLPAEQYAVRTGQHPRQTTEANIRNFKRQIKSLGFSYDWSREVDTTDPGYFKWTQWVFLRLYGAWFNPATQKAEPIATLTYPAELTTEAERRAYRDQRRLAYVAEAPVNWCAELGTVLANEEVIDGKSEVGGFPVVRKPMRQWMLRITAYAERLLRDLDGIDWSESLKEMQRNWIGRSEGAEVRFTVADASETITVFTTRPDTLFGATYMVLAPESKLVDALVPQDWPANTPDAWKGATPGSSSPAETVGAYRRYAANKSDLERTDLAKDKTGVFTGAFAINPVNGERIPIWIADYVLATYGTGAIMAVPAHDARDLEFATKFSLPIRQVVQAPQGKESIGYVDDGVSINSGFLDGLPTPQAKSRIAQWLEEKGLGRRMVNYKLRDWLFSRQRYWGEPFPIVWRQDASGAWYHDAIPDDQLPLVPPDLSDFKPTSTGEPPLARATDWVRLPDGGRRETNTMPQWAGSCWYYLRYLDARSASSFCGSSAEQYWMGTQPPAAAPARPGIDLYVGGAEHAVLHLLYARFWHKVLFDLGHASTPEPFHKLVNQGLILGEMEYTAFRDPSGALRSAQDVGDIEEEATPQGLRMVGISKSTRERVIGERVPEERVEKGSTGFELKDAPGIRVDARSFKMSKSRGNVINPDAILAEHGADAFRLYEMFMGPLEMVKPWSTKGVEGVYRFLGRVWRLFVEEQSDVDFQQDSVLAPTMDAQALAAIRLHPSIRDAEATPAQLKTLHTCIKKVTEDLDGLRFNTAISALMIFTSDAMTWETKPVAVLAQFLQLLQPFAPHLAEELYARLRELVPAPDYPGSVAFLPWPAFDPALLVEDTVEIPVQVNGKLRDKLVVSAKATQQEIEAAALASAKIQQFLAGKTIRKVIYVPGKLVNVAAA